MAAAWPVDSSRTLWHCGTCGLWTLHPTPSGDPSAIYDDAYYAGGYLSRVDVVSRFFNQQLAEVEKTVPVGEVLDVGCGLGLFVQEAARRGWRATGVDPSASAVRQTRQRTAAASGTEVLQGSFDRGVELSREFDLVTFWDSLCHVSDLKANLRGAVHVLKPGGSLVIKAAMRPDRAVRWALLFAAFKRSWAEAALHLATQWHQLTPRTLETWAPRFGLRMIRSYPVADPGETESIWSPPLSRAKIAQHVIEGIARRLAGSESFIAVLQKGTA